MHYQMCSLPVMLCILTLTCLQNDYSEMGAFMSKGQADGWLQPVVGQQYPLEQAADAHVEVIAHRTVTSGKIVLNM